MASKIKKRWWVAYLARQDRASLFKVEIKFKAYSKPEARTIAEGWGDEFNFRVEDVQCVQSVWVRILNAIDNTCNCVG